MATQPRLSPRQREILQLLADGLHDREIAGRLYLSVHTVKVHAAALLNRLAPRRRGQAVAHADQRGVLGAALGPAPPADFVPA